MKNNTLRQEREQRRREENRRFIISAAENVFAGRGYTLATMDEIAAESGFSKATLYKYFKSKKDIFLEIISSSLTEVEKKLRAILESDFSAEEKLRKYIRFITEYYHKKENLIRIFFLEKHTLVKLFGVVPQQFPMVSSKHPPIPQDFERGIFNISQIMDGIIAEGIRSKEFRAVDVQTASFVLGALIRGFQFRGPVRGPGLSFEESADMILNYFLKGIEAESKK